MKRKIYLLLLAVSTLGAVSCVDKKDENPDPGPAPVVEANAFTINGDGFANKEIALKATTQAHQAYYSNLMKSTYITLYGENDSLFITAEVVVYGNTVKTVQFSSQNFVTINMIHKVSGMGLDYNGTEGAIKLTTYGKVGEKIEGTYSGTFTEASTGNQVEITNGRFSVVRSDDQD